MEKTARIALGLIVMVLILVGVWYGLVRKPTAFIAPPKEPIKIGAILPLSGNLSLVGERIKNGIELAKEELNSQGGIKGGISGINGRNLEVSYEDSQGDTQQGVSAYQKLVRVQGINLLLSSITGVTLGIAPLAEEDRVLVFAVGTAAPKISEAGDYVFRHNLLPQTEAKVLADLIFNKRGYKEVGLLVVNSDSGVSYRDYFKKRFEELGGKIKIIEMYEKGSTDYRTPLTKIKATGVKAMLGGSYAKEFGFILRQAKELGLDAQWFSIYAIEEKEVLDIAGETANGVIFTHFFNPESSFYLIKEYQEKYKERYGGMSESYAALAYDTLKVLAEAMKKCENPDNATCVKNELYKIKDFPAVTGSITFDENGDTNKEIIIKTIKNGQFVPYQQ